MYSRRSFLIIVAMAVPLLVCGCGNRLVAANGQPTVTLYDNEDAYTVLQARNQIVAGAKNMVQRKLFGTLVYMAGTETRQVKAGTRVKIVSKGEKCLKVEVLQGPSKGYQGFVPKENIH